MATTVRLPGAGFVKGFEFQLFNDELEKRIGRATRTNLSRAGAFLRRTMRSSIRRSKFSAQPPSPPRAHGSLYKKILFGYDPDRQTVVVGFVRTRSQLIGGKTVPQLLESGGTVARRRRSPVLMRTKDARRYPKTRRRSYGLSRAPLPPGFEAVWLDQSIRYRAMPVVGPAYEKESAAIAALWENSI